MNDHFLTLSKKEGNPFWGKEPIQWPGENKEKRERGNPLSLTNPLIIKRNQRNYVSFPPSSCQMLINRHIVSSPFAAGIPLSFLPLLWLMLPWQRFWLILHRADSLPYAE